MTEPIDTSELARRLAHDGGARVDVLLAHDMEWLRRRVSERLGGVVRKLGDTDDFVQEAILRLLRTGPWFKTRSRATFRALLARLVENLLRDAFRTAVAGKRSLDREIASIGTATLDLDRRPGPGTDPADAADAAERAAWVRLALELLEPEDREVLWLRQIEGLSWAEVGERAGVAEDAARMRFRRALGRLAVRARGLRRDGFDAGFAGETERMS